MPPKIYRKQDLPINRPLTCLRGDTLRSPLFRHRDPVTKALLNLTGYTVSASGTLSDGRVIDLTPYLVLDLAGGRYRLIIPPSVTNGATPWPIQMGTYKVTLTDTLGTVTTYFGGDLGLKEVGHAWAD